MEQEAAGRLATARFVPAGEDEAGVVVDALFASSGIELEIVSDAERLELLPDFRVPVATIGHLIALKILARDDRTRPQDRADLVALLAAAAPDDVEGARRGIALITEWRFNRGRDLHGDLQALIRLRSDA
jgi:hypothetical protein